MYLSVPQPGTATAKSGLVMFPESESEPKADAREASDFSCSSRREIQWLGNEPIALGHSSCISKMVSELQSNVLILKIYRQGQGLVRPQPCPSEAWEMGGCL